MRLNKDKFNDEVRRRLKNIFNSLKEGFCISSTEKHRVEGFMQAGVFLGICSNEELYSIMQDVHLLVFDMSIEDKKKIDEVKWDDDQIDYASYEIPSFLRENK